VQGSSAARVVKSSGETETFDPNVIALDCVEAGVEFWTAAEVALEVSRKVYDGINSEEIQRRILKALYARSPEAAERYKRFHSMYVRTSRNTIERFDRKRIIGSLIRETSLPKEVAEIIARETETELRRMNLEFTSGPLIREIVNVKLLEHGYEAARSDYTRLGMPVYDAAQFIERVHTGGGAHRSPEAVHREMADSIFREYSLLKVLPLHLADAHMKGEIHVHELEHFAARPCTAYHDLRPFLKHGLRFQTEGSAGFSAGPARRAATAALHAAKLLLAFSTNFSSSQGLHHLNIWLAPYLQHLGREEVVQVAQSLLYELAQSFSLKGTGRELIDLELELGMPEHVSQLQAVLPGGKAGEACYADFEEEATELARALAEVYGRGDAEGRSLSPVRLIFKVRGERELAGETFHLIHEIAARGRPVSILNLYTSQLPPLSSAHSTGLLLQGSLEQLSEGCLTCSSLQRATINMPRAAYKAGGSDERLFEALDEMLELAWQVIMVKRDVIARRLGQGSLPFLSSESFGGGCFDLESSIGVVGYAGLSEAVCAHLGEEPAKSSYALDFAQRLVEHMSEELARRDETPLALSSVDSAVAARRFAMLDAGQFTEAGHQAQGRERYTASCHIPPHPHPDPLWAQEMEAGFQAPSKGGLMEVVNPGSRSPEELLEISRGMIKAHALSWSFAP